MENIYNLIPTTVPTVPTTTVPIPSKCDEDKAEKTLTVSAGIFIGLILSKIIS